MVPMLRTLSPFSIGRGLLRPEQAAEIAAANRVPAVALTDVHSLAGAWAFQKAMKAKGVQPIVGATVAFRETVLGQTTEGAIALLAQTPAGLDGITALLSRLALEGQALAPRAAALADLEIEGVIALVGGRRSPLLGLQPTAAEALAQALATLLPGRVAIDLDRHAPTPGPGETLLQAAAAGAGLLLVAAHETRYAAPEDHLAADVLSAISEGRTILDADRIRAPQDAHAIPDLEALFADLPEAIENARAIARRCAAGAPVRKPLLPAFPTQGGQTEAEALTQAARQGLRHRMGAVPEAYAERLNRELDVIVRMGFAGYFLTVADFIGWARSQGIPVGPGRGSGAGSLVAWALGIVAIDPIAHGLLFERFLNPDRVSLPDFDVDFHQGRRAEVVAYVRQRHGAARVLPIGAFGRILARAAVRDAARAMGLPYGLGDRIARLVPHDPANPVTIAEARLEPALAEAARDPQVAALLDVAQRIEGAVRTQSQHAAGVVIAPGPVAALAPVALGADGQPVLGLEMKAAEEAGLVKFDLLGLKTLDVLADAEAMAAEAGQALPEDPSFGDDAAYALLAKGDTFGVFQLESDGMRAALREVGPDRFSDLVALVSLYRPGPIAQIPTYAAVKHGRQAMEAPHPSIAGILAETNGVIVYQEQVMEIARTAAGYTLAQADLLRRAMGKKIRSELDAQRQVFLDGAARRGIGAEDAAKIFDLLTKFADYGFNKSHAAAYAALSYRAARLSARRPAAFFAALLQHDRDDADRLAVIGQEARRRGVRVLRPSVQTSRAGFFLEGDAVRWGLAGIRGVGDRDAEAVVAARGQRPFADLDDFLARVQGTVGRKALEALALAGALDGLAPTRADALARIRRGRDGGQASLLSLLEAAHLPEMPRAELLAGERAALGFYLSGHPLEGVAAKSRLRTLIDAAAAPRGTAEIAAVVLSVERKRTRQGRRLVILRLSDPTGTVEATAFDEALDGVAVAEDQAYRVRLQAEDRDGMRRFRIRALAPLSA